MAELVYIVDHQRRGAAQNHGSRPPTQQRVREVCSHIANILKISNPPSAEGLRRR
jgi:hypothetical protein